jgi:16S rRNA (guanine966-N2)-methyltransferase
MSRINGTCSVRRADALGWLASVGEGPRPFDIVFLDPPFDSDLAAAAAERLESRGWLTERALIYLEHTARAELPPLPARWTVRKSGRAGEVGYHLLERAVP